MHKEINFRVTKAVNGWIVSTTNHNGQYVESFVCGDDADLSSTIAAALVAKRIGDDPKYDEPKPVAVQSHNTILGGTLQSNTGYAQLYNQNALTAAADSNYLTKMTTLSTGT